ncbi:pentatricopeptide repeat-containing protein [Tanacetum coccineum]|uniref:Pentatricopeptide repeat-containing protein n=1 Tax=Tanacetum coccineum TaxID=301880 RepID=A0ABQ4Y3J4_9ASTR
MASGSSRTGQGGQGQGESNPSSAIIVLISDDDDFRNSLAAFKVVAGAAIQLNLVPKDVREQQMVDNGAIGIFWDFDTMGIRGATRATNFRLISETRSNSCDTHWKSNVVMTTSEHHERSEEYGIPFAVGVGLDGSNKTVKRRERRVTVGMEQAVNVITDPKKNAAEAKSRGNAAFNQKKYSHSKFKLATKKFFDHGSDVSLKILYELLEEIMSRIMEHGYVPETDYVLHDIGLEEKENALSYHSEKLAVAFGLLSINDENTAIRVNKNLRICGDCHEVMKLVSEAYKRDHCEGPDSVS